MVTLIGPGLAPLLGQAVLTHVGWRAIFALLALLGAVNLLLTALLLEETAVPTGRLAIGPLLHSQRELLGSRKFVGLAFGGAGATTATYSFFAAAPFIFVEQLHRPLDHVGIYLATMIFAAALGNALVARMVARRGIRRVILRANLLGIGSVALLGASILGGFFGWQLTLGAMATFTFVAGLISPIAMAQALDTDPRHVGAAAGSYGAIQMGVGALCTWLVGLGADPARSVTVVLLTAALISQLAFRATLPGAAERGPR
jgi:DHA1 family bicyclomycin/chloramphenicol resistance-like MFS transporter